MSTQDGLAIIEGNVSLISGVSCPNTRGRVSSETKEKGSMVRKVRYRMKGVERAMDAVYDLYLHTRAEGRVSAMIGVQFIDR